MNRSSFEATIFCLGRVITMMLFVAQWAETHTMSTQWHVWWLIQTYDYKALNKSTEPAEAQQRPGNSLKKIVKVHDCTSVCCCPE